MARIRTIKPKFYDDVKVGRLSRDARYLYIALWVFADDLGVANGDTIWLKSKIFPYDQIQIQQFEKWMNELVTNGFIYLLSYNGERFIYLPNFTRHQVVNRPNYEDLNIPKELIDREKKRIIDLSLNNHETITDLSLNNYGLYKEEEKGKEYIPPSNPPVGGGADLEEFMKKQKELEAKEIELQAKEQELLKYEAGLKAKKCTELSKIDFVSPEFADVFSTWIEYKRERKESYKSEKSLKAAYSKLLKLSGNNPYIASEIVEQSMANNWAGLFELKTEHNGNQNRKSYPNKQDANTYAFELLMQHKQELESGMDEAVEKPF